jgi:hypothetical protein
VHDGGGPDAKLRMGQAARVTRSARACARGVYNSAPAPRLNTFHSSTRAGPSREYQFCGVPVLRLEATRNLYGVTRGCANRPGLSLSAPWDQRGDFASRNESGTHGTTVHLKRSFGLSMWKWWAEFRRRSTMTSLVLPTPSYYDLFNPWADQPSMEFFYLCYFCYFYGTLGRCWGVFLGHHLFLLGHIVFYILLVLYMY